MNTLPCLFLVTVKILPVKKWNNNDLSEFLVKNIKTNLMNINGRMNAYIPGPHWLICLIKKINKT